MIADPPKEAFPLTWPTGRARTLVGRRRHGAFKSLGFGRIRDEMLAELRRLGASNVIVSTNVLLRRDGMPYADTREPEDSGVAVYFERRRRPYVLACDSYDKVWKNLRAVGATVEALRAIERHGSSEMLEQAFTGFAALPAARPAESSWWDVLGVSPDAPLDEIEAAHRRLTVAHHPDAGGDEEQMARINRARDIAREERAA